MLASFLKPFKIFWQAIGVWWDSWLELTILNLIVLLCWVTVILGPPATFGLFAVIHDDLEGGANPGLPGFWANAKKYAGRSYLWFGANLLIFMVAGFSFTFYIRMSQGWSILLGWTLLLICAGWFLFVQFFTIPFLLEQQKPALGLAWRNAAQAVLAWPYFTLVLVVFSDLLTAVGFLTIIGLLFIIPVLPAIVANLAVRDRLEALENSQQKG